MTFPFPTFVPAEESGGIASIVQQASATSSAATITWPAVQAGDIAVLFDVASGAFSTPSSVTPSGFTKMCEQEVFTQRAVLSFKVCDGTESGSLTGMSGNTNRKLMVTFRCTSAASSGTHGGAQNGAYTDGNPTAITVTSGSGAAPLIVVGAYVSSGTNLTPRTFTVGGVAAKDGEVGAVSNSMYIAWKIYLSSPADVVVDTDDNGSKNLVQGAYIQVS